MKAPKTLQDAILFFSNPDNCLSYLVARRWPDGVTCPACGSDAVRFISTRRLWECKNKHPRKQFSVKVGSIFEDSAIGLDKWLVAAWMLTNCKNGISSYELAKTIGVTQKSAWFMLHRLRLALQDDEGGGQLSGEVEVDETFIGGKARNMHKAKRAKVIQGRGAVGKTVVMSVLERGGKVKARIVANRNKQTLQENVVLHVEEGSQVFTDELVSYWGLDEKYIHQIINHAEEYVRGNVHTNGMESFWSLLKRGLNGP
jgi:transposase-like protein